MKVIDLLNKIANGEKVPNKIKYKGHIYHYQYKDTIETNIINYYYSEETHHHLINGSFHDIRLNDEVEIPEEKKIPEKLDIRTDDTNMEYIKGKTYGKNYSKSALEIAHTINEIIDYLQYLKSKGE